MACVPEYSEEALLAFERLKLDPSDDNLFKIKKPPGGEIQEAWEGSNLVFNLRNEVHSHYLHLKASCRKVFLDTIESALFH